MPDENACPHSVRDRNPADDGSSKKEKYSFGIFSRK